MAILSTSLVFHFLLCPQGMGVIEKSDVYTYGLSKYFKTEKLSFYVLIDQKYKKIKNEKLLSLHKTVDETWYDMNRIQKIHSNAKSWNYVSQKVWDKE